MKTSLLTLGMKAINPRLESKERPGRQPVWQTLQRKGRVATVGIIKESEIMLEWKSFLLLVFLPWTTSELPALSATIMETSNQT